MAKTTNVKNKKNIALIIGGLILLSAFVLNIYSSDSLFSNKKSAVKSQGGEDKNFSVKDSDKDGLKNWEETLYGTDSENPDTDGDGTKDGEETKLNRDPLKAGPNDKATSTSAIPSKSASSTQQNQTEKVAQRLLTAYTAIKKQGQEITEDQKRELVNYASKDIDYKIQSGGYTLSDISVIKNPTQKQRESFKDEYIKTIKTLEEAGEYEILLLAKAAEDKNVEENLEKLEKRAELCFQVVKQLLDISVPDEGKEKYLNFINNLNKMGISIKKMSFLKEDPMQTITGVKSFSSSEQDLKKAAEKLNSYVNKISQ